MKAKLRIPVTIVILLLNIAGMIYEYTQGQRLVLYRYGMYQGALQDGEWLRLAVSAFLHLLLLHPCLVKMTCSRALSAEFGVKCFCI